jgi:hypothetical protein
MTLFSHGVESIGLAALERFAKLRGRAREGSALLGVATNAFPRDFGDYLRYQRDLRDHSRDRFARPSRLRFDELDASTSVMVEPARR